MARTDVFETKIERFIRKNRHMEAWLKETPVNGGTQVEIVCERIGEFVVPDGTRIEKQKGHCYLVFIKTGEFLEIIRGVE